MQSNPTDRLLSDLAAQYETDGFVVAPQLLPRDLLARVDAAMDDVMAGRYETGRPPIDFRAPNASPHALCKIDQPHWANRTILELVSNPALGRAIAAITGARRIQAWVVQLLHKPCSADDTAASVGWHQDYQYWQNWWTPDSDLFTAWIAITDVGEESGPVTFVRGSHRWGLIGQGDFFSGFGDTLPPADALPAGAVWSETTAAMPAGAFSLHHRLTYHGSRPNVSEAPRRSFALHLCSERATPTPGRVPPQHDHVAHLHDPERCPVLFEA